MPRRKPHDRRPDDAESLEERLARVVREAGRPVPLEQGIPELYRRAVLTLAGDRPRAGIGPLTVAFTPAEARAALHAAAYSLTLPMAPEVPEQPDPADVPAFLRTLAAVEMASRGPDGWVLHLNTTPF